MATPGKKRKLKDGTIVYDVSYYQSDGKRRSKTFYSAAAARLFHAEKVQDNRRRRAGGTVRSGDISFRGYAARHLTFASVSWRERTLLHHESCLRNHLLPRFGDKWMSELARDEIKTFLVELNAQINPRTGKRRYRPRSLKNVLKRLNVILNAAVDDGVIDANPAARVGKVFRPKDDEPRPELSFTEHELYRVLKCCKETHYHCFPLFLLMARTGLRSGEALALEWHNVEFVKRRFHVVQALGVKGGIQKTKTDQHRTVDMSQELAAVLTRHRNEQVAASHAHGRVAPSLVFPDIKQRHTAYHVKRILDRLEMQRHYHPHSFRHTFARLLLERGVRVEDVQRRMGHVDIHVTNGLYGRHADLSGTAAVDQLDQNLLDLPDVDLVGTGTQ